ncbi:SxtJ family membrane protein [Mariprofundus ferrooxydans]|uniref:SxtJ n=1 Tax=Mariprofundus ferrooxydans PV-1 TaxID=314345 RepID=Q0EXY7_9PROT|nr:SxtJ family membrane protein [Mariprofundus ferrooxydans]EAU54065.1 hypothetical protein SPV1_00507 [Mariprofundus ferrooxydans PV-1]
MLYRDIPELDAAGLRRFGLLLGGIFVLLFGLLFPWLRNSHDLPNLLWVGSGAVIIVWALAAPVSMRRLYNGWMRVALIIGNVMNRIILAIVFFFVITPMGLVMRIMGKDPMRRRFDKTVASYRVISKPAARNHVERPF